jgi:hypothetical protein
MEVLNSTPRSSHLGPKLPAASGHGTSNFSWSAALLLQSWLGPVRGEVSASLILLEHLQSAHPQLVNLQFANAEPAYARLANAQPPDRHGTDRQGAHCSCSHRRGKEGCESDR